MVKQEKLEKKRKKMINKQYLKIGEKIRKDYIDTSKKLETILYKIKDVSEKLQGYSKEFMAICDKYENNNKNDNATGEEIKKKIFSKLVQVEKQGKILNDEYKPLNEKIEELKKEEEILYKNVKEKYPELSDEKIREIFENHLG